MVIVPRTFLEDRRSRRLLVQVLGLRALHAMLRLVGGRLQQRDKTNRVVARPTGLLHVSSAANRVVACV